MKRAVLISNILLLIAVFPVFQAAAQEFTAPIRWNPFQNDANKHKGVNKAARKTAATLTLPFFEDFTGYSPAPDSNKWADFEVYVNNTMGASPVSRGVATFDDLNAIGIPYDSFSNSDAIYADSLTSQPIDLSTDSAADSVYLSFFYQPQGTGFYPVHGDSLMLFLKNVYGDFVKVWAVDGSGLQPFQQVMIPITDSLYFHNAFQFRFVNIAALNWADAVWNVDYIRMDVNRSIGDTAINDVAFTSNPTFLLNDYTSMPYTQFTTNPFGELASQVSDSIRNNSAPTQAVNYSMEVRDQGSSSSLSSGTLSPFFAGGYSTNEVTEPLSITTFPGYPAGASVVFQTKYYLQTAGALGSVTNDTVVGNQVFDNYLAYDDGTAEKSYYLNLFSSLPGKIAIEYHLNHPDTLRGMAIYFGRQIPFSSAKLFVIYVYTALAGVNGAPYDVTIDSSDLLIPAYADSVNHFWYYTFNNPLLLPAGTFYAGTLQPLGGGSDSLYFGLDVNRIGANHAYFNVLGNWSPSLISGAIMMRPLLGRYVSGSGVKNVNSGGPKWEVFPNPAKDMLQFKFEGDDEAAYSITDIQGRELQKGTVATGNEIDISSLAPGMYFVNLANGSLPGTPQKIIKL